MAKKFKLDKDKLKQFLLQKVEVVAVGAAGLLALLLLVVGLTAAFGTGSPAAGIRASNQALGSSLKSTAGPAEADPKDKPNVQVIEWTPTPLNAFRTAPWYDASAAGDPKKRNPTVRGLEVVTPDGKGNLTQVTAYGGGVFVYRVMPLQAKIEAVVREEDKAAKTAGQPAQHVRTEHLAVVEGIFPYKEQVKDYLKALRIDRVEDLVSRGLVPTFVGLNVFRTEIRPDGKPDWQPVYQYEKDGKFKLSPANARLLKDGVYYQTRVEQYQQYLPPSGGADTPFPKLVVGEYPPLKLEGIALNEVEPAPDTVGAEREKGPNPMPPGGIGIPGPPMPGQGKIRGGGNVSAPAENEGKLLLTPLKSYGKAFAERVLGKVNPFSVYGVFPDAEDATAGTPAGVPGQPYVGEAGMGMPSRKGGKGFLEAMRPPGSKKGGEGGREGGQPKAADVPDGLPEKVVIRFVDAGLEPGKAYQYSVQVLLKNPNFGKAKEVAFPAMAKQEVLDEGPWVLTQPVYVPQDFAFYVVYQDPLVSKKVNGGNDKLPIPEGKIPVQIHQLIDDSCPSDQETNRKIGEWVVAERIFLGRGDLIARRNMQVEVPYWNTVANAFVLGSMVRVGKRLVPKESIPVDFGDPESSPVLADFWGGNVAEANVEVLVLTAEGRLGVRSSHEDSDPENEIGKERLRRYEAWRSRLQAVRNAGQASTGPATGPGGISVPGGKGKGPQ